MFFFLSKIVANRKFHSLLRIIFSKKQVKKRAPQETKMFNLIQKRMLDKFTFITLSFTCSLAKDINKNYWWNRDNKYFYKYFFILILTIFFK